MIGMFLGKIHLPKRIKIQALGEVIHKSDKEIKEAHINKLGLHFKRIMQSNPTS